MEHYHNTNSIRELEPFAMPTVVTRRMTYQVMRQRFVSRLAEDLIEAAEAHEFGLTEGVVSSLHPSYRRLDCDGRALAYIRTRPRLKAVRVDVARSWRAVEPCRLSVPSKQTRASLMIHHPEDLEAAVLFLGQIVLVTRDETKRDERRRVLALAKRMRRAQLRTAGRRSTPAVA